MPPELLSTSSLLSFSDEPDADQIFRVELHGIVRAYLLSRPTTEQLSFIQSELTRPSTSFAEDGFIQLESLKGKGHDGTPAESTSEWTVEPIARLSPIPDAKTNDEYHTRRICRLVASAYLQAVLAHETPLGRPTVRFDSNLSPRPRIVDQGAKPSAARLNLCLRESTELPQVQFVVWIESDGTSIAVKGAGLGDASTSLNALPPDRVDVVATFNLDLKTLYASSTQIDQRGRFGRDWILSNLLSGYCAAVERELERDPGLTQLPGELKHRHLLTRDLESA